MAGPDPAPGERPAALRDLIERLSTEFAGSFDRDTVERIVADSWSRRAARAPGGRAETEVELLAKERLAAMAHPAAGAGRTPAVLFLCTHNAGRSQMALGWFAQLAGGRAIAWSGGSEPAAELNPSAVAAMAELGIDISGGFPKPWSDEILAGVDVVVTMGCGDACPYVPGKRYEDWPVEDPAGRPLAEVRPIRDEIGERVRDLLARLGVPG
jgi:protein-tyrosine-phosphatase